MKEVPPDFGVPDVEGVLQLVLPGQPSTQPLHHAVAQDLQVTASGCSCKGRDGGSKSHKVRAYRWQSQASLAEGEVQDSTLALDSGPFC